MRGAAGPRDLRRSDAIIRRGAGDPGAWHPAAIRHSPDELLAAEIYESWLRCVALGLDSTRPPAIDMASPKTLRSEQEQRVLLRGLALAEMRTLHDQIAGSNFLIAFATPEGLLLDVVADKSFADTPEAKNIRPGSLWSETLCGTNGIGTAAFLKRPVVVHGNEHYFPSFGSLTCAASPIFAPDGSLGGHPRCFV